MLAVLLSAALGLNAAQISRRQAIIGSSFATTAGTVLPAAAANKVPPKGPSLIVEAFTIALPAGRLLDWYEQHLTATFVADIDGVALDRAAFLSATASMLASFPDLEYSPVNIAFANGPTTVGWIAYYKGTHSGAPFSPLPGVPAVPPRAPPVRYASKDFAEVAFADFAPNTGLLQIERLTVKQLTPGPGKYSAGAGLYIQAGGDTSKLPPLSVLPPPPAKMLGLF